MRLRSVLAVPIRAPEGVLGALYLDNRFSRGRFDERVVSLLLGFADHAALVLRSLRLIAELRARTAELEQARGRAESLAEERAREIVRLESEVESRQRVLERRHDFGAIVGRSAALERLFDTLDRVVDAPVPVLVVGESGTGKELVARALHFAGARKTGPFVSINCGALPASLLEAELFGHARGAFTGAERDREGLVVASRGGTLFLDELGELPLELQAKLLRVLQEREVRPVGSDRTISVDFRLVTATNRDLAAEVAQKRFREDLYYRVSVVTLPLPPLRERRDDIPLLARHFVDEAARKLGVSAPVLSPRALRALLAHPFPGNVRELENALVRAVVLAESGTIEPGDLGLSARALERRPERSPPSARDERRALEAALLRAGWNAREAARGLGISRATLYRKLQRHGIERPRS
jgi:transcriptional regulator with GAF, ATPase, and Fis domain